MYLPIGLSDWISGKTSSDPVYVSMYGFRKVLRLPRIGVVIVFLYTYVAIAIEGL